MAMLALLVLAVSILGFGEWEQPQRLRGLKRKHALAEHNDGFGDVDRPLRHDRADHGAGRFAGAQEGLAAERRHLPGLRRHVCRAAAGHGAVYRRVELPDGADARSDRRALPDPPGKIVLTIGPILYDAQTSFAV